MSYSIPEHIIQQIRETADIVEVIADHVRLIKRGKSYLALCPFHEEKTPSFNVNSEKQIFYCFGCKKGGDVFRFLTEYDQMTFVEAVRFLAKRYGIHLPETSAAADESSQNLQSALHDVNEFAAQHFAKQLQTRAPEAVLAYIQQRHIEKESWQKFQLGYAMPNWDDLLRTAHQKQYSDELLLQAGLIRKSEKGASCYDCFRHRLMFPIYDHRGHVIAFGGRALAADEPAKYINSPESPVFQKSTILYGLHQAKKHLRDENLAVLVEGYVDVVSLHQAGIPLAVAPLGTALTNQQAKLLRRYVDRVAIALDSDFAGIKATVRSIPILLQEGFELTVVKMPEGDDPDSFVQKNGGPAFRQLLTQARDFFDFLLEQFAKDHDLRHIDGKARLAQEMAKVLTEIQDPIRISLYRHRLTDFLQINEHDLASILPLKNTPIQKISVQTKKAESKQDKAERGLLRCFIEDHSSRMHLKADVSPDYFLNPVYRQVATFLWEHDAVEGVTTSDELLQVAGSEALVSVLTRILVESSGQPQNSHEFSEWLSILKLSRLNLQIAGLKRELMQEPDNADILKKIQSLIHQRNEATRKVV